MALAHDAAEQGSIWYHSAERQGASQSSAVTVQAEC